MDHRDPYQILGVSRTASQDEIKRAYRKLARQYHPDRNRDDKRAEERFKEVQAAYEVVGDPERRAQFDQFGAGGPAPDYSHWTHGGPARPQPGVDFDFSQFGGGQAGFDLSDIIEQFFRRGGGGAVGGRARSARSPARRGADLEHVVYVTLEEAARGTTREVLLQAAEQGARERIEFRVPPGVEDGQKIRIAGRGHAGPGGRGDLMIVCRVQPHPVLRREGDTLHVDALVSFPQAALGAKVEVATLDGSALVTIPPGTSSGARLRLRERGMPAARGGGRGDLIVHVRVGVPRTLSPRARELIEALREELEPAPAPAPTEN